MADNLMKKLPFTRFAMEMRSGKIINIDEGFVKMLGYRGRHGKWPYIQGYCAGC